MPESTQATAAEPKTEEEAHLQWAAEESGTGKKKKITGDTEQGEEEVEGMDREGGDQAEMCEFERQGLFKAQRAKSRDKSPTSAKYTNTEHYI